MRSASFTTSIARGIERRPIFADDEDRDDLLARLASLARADAWAVYAWALMPNHLHLLVRTAAQSLERSMRALLSGYATRYNRRHGRAGHLFQNRYKSIVCEEEPYFLALVRYIHRNPVPSVVPDLRMLARYPYTGHSALLGTIRRDWQATEETLRWFGAIGRRAIRSYLEFMGDEAASETNLEGGGLHRSLGIWTPVTEVKSGRERFKSDERILGTSTFVERMRRELRSLPRRQSGITAIVECVSASVGIAPSALNAGTRRTAVSIAREGIAYLWILRLGGSGRALALHLGLAPSGVHRAARRGARDAIRWDALLGTLHTASEQSVQRPSQRSL